MVKNKFVGCYVNEEEYNTIQQKVTQYGFKNTSEYIRSALDFFDERRYNASKNNEVAIISDCIKLLKNHQKEVQSTILKESLSFKDLDKNLKNENLKTGKTLKDSTENLKGNLKGFEEETLKDSDENLKSSNDKKQAKQVEPFENIINTLIRITHSKGKPTDEDFKFQANRCGKTKKEVIEFYDSNYDFFIKESDKLY